MRNSDVSASLYWLARLIEGGADPLFIARRLVRFAVEDIGMADPNALTQTLAAWDTYDRLGLDAIAQVNLGVRAHRNRPLAELGPMSRQVVATLLSRCGIPDSGVGLTQFFVDGDGYTPRTSTVSLADRPPMNTLAAGRPRH